MNTNKSNMPFTPDTRSRLASMSKQNARGKFPKYDVPSIRMNGNTGVFTAVPSAAQKEEGKTEAELKAPVSVVILRSRKSLGDYNSGLFSSEYDDAKSHVKLFKRDEGGISLAAEGLPAQVREKFPMLRVTENLYCMTAKGNVVKVGVKGASLGEYYTYSREGQQAGFYLFEVWTKLKRSEAKKNKASGGTFYSLNFEADQEKEIDSEAVEKAIVEVNDAFEKIDAYAADSSEQRQAERDFREMAEEIPAGIKYPDEDINVDDIPF